MNRHERRPATSAAEHHPDQQKCACGWLMPREVFVEQLTIGPPVARIRIVIICPICERRATVEVGQMPSA